MREPSPDPVVAAAKLNPPSPTPVSIQPAIQNTVVPNLHGQAATADEVALSPAIATEPPVPHHHPDTMGSDPEPAEISDTIVVGGDYSDESHDESDGSIDYGEGEERQEQEAAEPDAAVDDYARTFDSPAAHEDQAEAEDAQPDVSMASESMNSPSAPDPAAALSDHPPSPTPPPAGAPAASSTPERADVSGSPSETPPSAAPDASPSPAAPATASATEPAGQSPSTASAPDATPASADEDDAAVDIQKLVDDITARAAATDSPPPTAPAQAAAPVTAAVTAQAAPPAALSVSLPPSLPPKPSLPNPPASLPAIPPAHYSFPPRGSNAPAAPAVSMATASPGAPHGSYSAHEGISSLPAPPPGGFGGPPHAHTHHMPLNGDASSGHYHGSSTKQLWDQFQADEKRYTSEAKWERFPEGSRIFIGESSHGHAP